jgi:5'-nucleotidase
VIAEQLHPIVHPSTVVDELRLALARANDSTIHAAQALREAARTLRAEGHDELARGIELQHSDTLLDILRNAPRDWCWVQTASGQVFDFVGLLLGEPQPIDLLDVAHHLGAINRYCGATRVPYSVAEHSCLVATLVTRMAADAGVSGTALREWAIAGWMHDAPEYVLQDLPRPLKLLLDLLGIDIYGRLEDALEQQVEQLVGVTPSAAMRTVVKRADKLMLFHERRALMAEPQRPWRTDDDAADEGLRAYPVGWTADVAARRWAEMGRDLGVTL